MNRFENYKHQLSLLIFASMILVMATILGSFWLVERVATGSPWLAYAAAVVANLFLAALLTAGLAKYVTQPLKLVWQAILHVLPERSTLDQPAPNIDDNKVAAELVTSLVMQVYQLASLSERSDDKKLDQNTRVIVDSAINLPLPLLAVDKKQIISFANEAALTFLGLPANQVIKQNVYTVLDMSFSDDKTLDSWLQDCRANKAKASHSWHHIRLKLADQKTLKQFDLAASYSKENPEGIETIITIFDQSERYGNEDQSLDFIALAVHELRTPLTSLRGYVEVFEDELTGKLSPELTGFMHQMHLATTQLTAFINNILNVARIQEGHLSLQLHQENWGRLIQEAVNNLALQAQLHSKVINYSIDANVPLAGVDKVSITEVINNLVDNAIKYSGDSQVITINSHLGTDGMVETSVHDDGVGIPATVMPTLFEKFQRNHRNQAKIGGTGLGLYLCASLVKAHGGNIWVNSKEGEGTTLSFTVQPYSQLAGKLKNSDNTDIVRSAQGWVKNHSLYRR